MKTRMPPDIPLAIVIFAAVAVVALRAAARRPEPPQMPGTEPAPIAATTDDSGSGLGAAVTTGMHATAGPELARPAGTPGRPDSAVEQMEYIFHELHADGRNSLCGICNGQYWH
jgi:hypothetical protein